MITVIFGQPHSGKTTLSNKIQSNFYIDGDHLRDMFKNKDYSKQGRINNLNRASDIATYLHYNGNDVVLSLVYPYKECRDYLNSLVPNVKWIYLTYDIDRGREQYHVSDFEESKDESVLSINTDKYSIDECIHQIKNYVG
jgi:adenylylsulfate kinase-like enzyme